MMSEEKDYGPQLANMRIDTEVESEYMDARTKMTLRTADAEKLVVKLTELIEQGVEKINITAFLKNSQYGDGNYYGNLKVDEVGAAKAKGFKPKASGAKAKVSSAKARIESMSVKG